MKKWECCDLGKTTEFLWMKICQDGHQLAIDQCKYLEKVLEHCRMINAKPAHTLLPEEYKPSTSTVPVNPELQMWFQTVIGSLLYLMLGTHPDIAYAVTLMVRMSANSTQEHLDKALYICHYLISTHDYLLVFDGNSGNSLIMAVQKTVNPPPDFTSSWQIQYFSGTHISRRLLLCHPQKQSTWPGAIVLIRLYGSEACLERLVSIYYLYQSVVTIKGPYSWETTLLQNIAQDRKSVV